MDKQEAIEYSIQILKGKKEELEESYKDSVEVKQRIEKEPLSFSWKWEDNGYWVIIFNEYPAEIKKIGIRYRRPLRQRVRAGVQGRTKRRTEY
jgi:hypothetical protein